MKSILAILVAVFLSGCTSSRGFDRGELNKSLQGSVQQVTEDEIKQAYELKPQLPSPYKLAVYFDEPKRNENYYYYRDQHPLWRGEDKDSILLIGKELLEKGVISDMYVISSTEAASDLKSIRLSAARHGADAVLIINTVTDIDRYNNPWGVSYVLLVPMAFLPGSEMDALVMTKATMWDVKNQYLYLTAEAEGTDHQTRPLMFIRETQATSNAKKIALNALREELTTRLKKTAGVAETR
ncbi:MAG TPA: hypothetical protein VGB89_14840 [Bacteroidota bacterium]